MPTDFDDALTGLWADADRLLLPEPADLRAAGNARTRRHVLVVASLVVIVIALIAGAGLAVAGARPSMIHPAGPGPAPSLTGPAPATGGTRPSPSAPGASAQVTPPGSSASGVATCGAASLTFVTRRDEGAMGSAYTTFVLRNATGSACRLTGPPDLRHGTAGAPAGTFAGQTTTVVVPAHAMVEFATRRTNGYGGYQPGDPACAHPATYAQLSLRLPDASSVELGTGTITVQCGSLTVMEWKLSS